jgi:hypothetical protein
MEADAAPVWWMASAQLDSEAVSLSSIAAWPTAAYHPHFTVRDATAEIAIRSRLGRVRLPRETP